MSRGFSSFIASGSEFTTDIRLFRMKDTVFGLVLVELTLDDFLVSVSDVVSCVIAHLDPNEFMEGMLGFDQLLNLLNKQMTS
jgi:hypothetical protein